MAGVCPGNDESAGKRRSAKTPKGSKWLRATLTESALAATRTKNSYLDAQYQRLRGRRGHSKPVTAVGHAILTAAWHMLQTGELYRDLGGDHYTRPNPDRVTRRLIRPLEALGRHVTASPRTLPPDGDFASAAAFARPTAPSIPPIPTCPSPYAVHLRVLRANGSGLQLGQHDFQW